MHRIRGNRQARQVVARRGTLSKLPPEGYEATYTESNSTIPGCWALMKPQVSSILPAISYWPCVVAGHIGNRRVRRVVARRGIQRRTPLKTGKLITPRVTWPSFDAGLSMELAGTTPEGTQLFRYVHSMAYRVSQSIM